MPHKTRYDRFIEFYERYSIDKKIKKLPETPSCVDFHSQEFYIPGVSDAAEYIHKLNLLVKPTREHALDCKRCAIQLEALLLSQTNPKLFTEALGKILAFESHYDDLKQIYVAGLPYPHHEANPQTGRIVYVAPRLPLSYAVRDFLGRIGEHFGDKIIFSKFVYDDKYDGKRKPCHQGKANILNSPGYISIRSRHGGNLSEEDLRLPKMREKGV